MFICLVCNETFVGVYQDTAYTTKCGHVFHQQCLTTWLERSKTCPYCRSSVLENNLVKLFLQIDPNARETWDTNTDEEINTLKEEIKSLKQKEISYSNKNQMLSTQIKLFSSTINSSFACNNIFINEAENQKKKNFEISAELKLMTQKYNESEIEIKRLNDMNTFLQSKTKALYLEFHNKQSSNSSAIRELKLEIADLKSEKAFLQSSCYNNMKNINIEQPSTSKMNIENINALTLPNHTKSKYYGYDPQLRLSTEQFLLGCVFLIIEAQNQQENKNIICSITTMAKDNIIKYGGTIEQFYCTRVTHIICVTLEHRIVEQGTRDGKRCVTYYWLNDIISKKSMIPPWLGIHFPVPHSKNNLPCRHFQFSIINFDASEGDLIKAMIDLVGGGHVFNEVTSITDIVISRKLEGKLVKKAVEGNKPVVNVQWLNDILFGAKIGIKELGNLKYQQFDLCNPFLVDYNMIPHLMEAWKTPLTIYNNQQVCDLTLNPDSPTKRKRQKTTPEHQNITNLIDDDIEDDDVTITYIKTLPLKPCVMLSGFSTDENEIFKMIVNLFGGRVTSHYFETTHLVMKNSTPSKEFYGCISTVKYILNGDWLRDSHSTLKLLDEKEYFLENIRDHILGLCNVPAILKNNNRRILFRDLSFFVTPEIKYPPAHYLEQIISSAGGKIEKTRRSLESIRGLVAKSYFIISRRENYLLYKDLLDIDDVIYLPEFITCSILKQEVQLQKYSLKLRLKTKKNKTL